MHKCAWQAKHGLVHIVERQPIELTQYSITDCWQFAGQFFVGFMHDAAWLSTDGSTTAITTAAMTTLQARRSKDVGEYFIQSPSDIELALR